ncbi:E3 ubiquitin-protein ligase RNF138-like [Ascaphus truei]|uniref:E3 ubiquitin-protein ligase RNF138-like n=1 Tax=Ascaphus truei TaxID=8439 RepID=UPI003F5933E6
MLHILKTRMDKASSSSALFPDEDFYCPICQEVLQTPVKTLKCEHIFCRKCFLTAMKTSGVHCPLCRGPIKKKERSAPERATDIEAEMRNHAGRCKCCEKKVKFHFMRRHYRTCRNYQEEYGTVNVKEEPKILMFDDSVGNRTDTTDTTESSTVEDFPVISIQQSFKCPLCSEDNFDRRGLLEHCNRQHVFQIIPVICPICASMPLVDANHITRNVVQHLNERHQFDYAEFVNFQLDEETQYQSAVEESTFVND